MGFHVDTIVPIERKIFYSFPFKAFIESPFSFILKVPRKFNNLIVRFLKNKKYIRYEKIKEKKIEDFSRLHLNQVFVDVKELNKLSYNYYITGSDQVWNENWTKPYFFLDFSNRSKNISFAASIGKDNISIDFETFLKSKLKNLKAISVREFQLANIIFRLTNNLPQVVLDPTLMLTNIEWNNLAKKSIFEVKQEYLLTYFLGKPLTREVEEFASKNGLIVINLLNPKNKKYLISSIEDFLNLFSRAKFIVTDSYHGTIFSIIFKKQFITILSDDKNSRIFSLCEMLEIENRFNDFQSLEIRIDYDKVENNLNVMRTKSRKFLTENLSL